MSSPQLPPSTDVPEHAPPRAGGIASRPYAGRSSRLRNITVIALVAIVIAFGLVVAGVIPGITLFGRASATSGISSWTALTRASVSPAARGAGRLVFFAGISTPYAFSFGELSGNASCPVSNPLTSNLTVPAQTGSYSSGEATVWVLLYLNRTGPSESVLAVTGSSTYLLGRVTGTGCIVGGSTLLPVPANASDSTSAAAAFDTDAGGFTAGHPTASALYVFLNNASGADWLIAYTNCSYDPQTHEGQGGEHADLLEGFVNGTTGGPPLTRFSSDLNCSDLNASEIPMGLAVGGPPGGLAWAGMPEGAPAPAVTVTLSTGRTWVHVPRAFRRGA